MKKRSSGWADERGYCGLMLAARITLPHFSVSSAISFPKSAGEPASTNSAEFGRLCLHGGIGEAAIDTRGQMKEFAAGRFQVCRSRSNSLCLDAG